MEADQTTAPRPARTVIKPPRGWPAPSLRELWENRDLIYFLARRDVVVRYKQATVGIFWAVLQPIILAVVFAVFLGALAKVPSEEGVPYPLLVVSGFVMWLAFSNALTAASMSTMMSDGLISKIYFPRIAIPISSVVPAAVDIVLGFVVCVIAGMLYGFFPDWHIIFVPFTWMLALGCALGFGLWIAALNVAYRDFALAIPFLLIVGMFVTPIVYPFELILEQVPPSLQMVYALNPMVGVLELFRWSVLGGDWPGRLMLIPIAMCLITLVSGAFYYQRAEPKFADVI